MAQNGQFQESPHGRRRMLVCAMACGPSWRACLHARLWYDSGTGQSRAGLGGMARSLWWGTVSNAFLLLSLVVRLPGWPLAGYKLVLHKPELYNVTSECSADNDIYSIISMGKLSLNLILSGVWSLTPMFGWELQK